MPHGANPSDWDHFANRLGLKHDLLPVVSNPDAIVSERSTIKALGKVPSLYNRDGKVVGISKWTQKQATAAEVEKWSGVADYGICVQTRRVRALDVDVEKSADVLNMVMGILGALPVRQRSNSGKCLIAFVVEGELYKRVLPVAGGIVELLADGQQFIAVGEHVSGVRYEWDWCGNEDFPVVEVEDLDRLWAALEWQFGTAPTQYASARREGAEGGVWDGGDAGDDILPLLQVLSRGRDGEAFIECPFKDQHTKAEGGRDEAAGTSTAYFPAGSGGYERGHFKCLHAHCSGRTDAEFEDALGIRAAGFDAVDPAWEDWGTEAGEESGRSSGRNHKEITIPGTLKKNKKGYLPTLSNLEKVFDLPELVGEHIAYDSFKGEVVTATHTVYGKQWREFTDDDYTRLRIWLESVKFQPVGRELMRDIINHTAGKNTIDTAIEWLGRLVWDGVSRVDGFLNTYFGCEGTEYTTNVSKYIWTALAGRILSPGIKADIVPILVGVQGAGKSFGVSEMVPDADFYTTVNLMERDDNLNRCMRGKLVLEIAELRGLNFGKDKESIKDFITHTHDRWVPKFVEKAKTYPRRSLFIGTTNNKEFLGDTTGNRRWAPLKVVDRIDVALLRKDRLQLWAEGAVMFKSDGIAFSGVEKTFSEAHKEHRITDNITDLLDSWWQTPGDDGILPMKRKFFTSKEAVWDCLGVNFDTMNRHDQQRIGEFFREKGCEKKDFWIDKKNVKGWYCVNP